jgi:murein DD-endopeptidase MepM/ murein hydrolase activator NlpD
MAGSLGDFGSDLIGALGGKPTKQSKRLFNSWQRWEGGHTANSATWNPLNLTAPGSGLRTINSVGVVQMPNRQEGLRRTTELIKTGYPAIAAALRSGQVDYNDPDLQADLNRWLSGKRTPGMTPYVRKIAGSAGSALPPSSPAAVMNTSIPTPPAKPEFDPMAYAENIRNQFVQGSGRVNLLGVPGTVASSFTTPPPQAAPEASSPPSGAANPYKVQPGKGILAPAAFKQTHETSNLGWPAVDIMGKPGTPLRSPVAGTVVRHGSAQGGEAMYIDTDGDGEGDYWAGHITGMVPVGTQLKPGDRFAYISPDHAAPHLHWAKR